MSSARAAALPSAVEAGEIITAGRYATLADVLRDDEAVLYRAWIAHKTVHQPRCGEDCEAAGAGGRETESASYLHARGHAAAITDPGDPGFGEDESIDDESQVFRLCAFDLLQLDPCGSGTPARRYSLGFAVGIPEMSFPQFLCACLK